MMPALPSQKKKRKNLPLRNTAVIFFLLKVQIYAMYCLYCGSAWFRSQHSLTYQEFSLTLQNSIFKGSTELVLIPGKGNLSMSWCRAQTRLLLTEHNCMCLALLLLTGDIISTLLLWITFQFCGQ